jgi:hypothetical protein
VLTSSESASSIDTQFDSLCDDLKQRLKSRNVILDEKKCGNIKSAIEHIISKLEHVFGVVRVNTADDTPAPKDEEDSGGDSIHLDLREDNSSFEIENSDH